MHQPIREHAAATGLEPEFIRFTGFVPETDKVLWYNVAHLFVYPSQYEGFGLPPLEALACGTPVVTSDRSSMPEVVGQAAILVDPTSVKSIADGMQRAIEDSALRDRLHRDGIDRARSFSWEKTAEQTLAVYRAATATK